MWLTVTSPVSSRVHPAHVDDRARQEPDDLRLDQPRGRVAVGDERVGEPGGPGRERRAPGPGPRSGPSPRARASRISPALLPVETLGSRAGHDRIGRPLRRRRAGARRSRDRPARPPPAPSPAPRRGSDTASSWRRPCAARRSKGAARPAGPRPSDRRERSQSPSASQASSGTITNGAGQPPGRRAKPLRVGPGAPVPPQLDDRQLEHPPGLRPDERQRPASQLGVLVELVERPDVRARPGSSCRWPRSRAGSGRRTGSPPSRAPWARTARRSPRCGPTRGHHHHEAEHDQQPPDHARRRGRDRPRGRSPRQQTPA